MKQFLRPGLRAGKPLIRRLVLMFFDRRYIAGRHFEKSMRGYIWAARSIWMKNILRLAAPTPWPSALTCHVSNPRNICFHPDDLNNFQSQGTYFQNLSAKIVIGRGTYIAPNVGIITANHNLENLDEHERGQDVELGENCWIGMNSVILPGVKLGPRTIVAAGAVVNKSFPGGLVLGGVPARVLKVLGGRGDVAATSSVG